MTAPTLRPYQQETVAAVFAALRRGVPAPLACLPTGAGKSLVVAEICRQAVMQWGGRVVVLVHVKELVAQLAESIRRSWPDAFCPLGIISAGLGQRSVDKITVAGIQSAFRRACDLGARDLILVDECQLIPPDGDGMYRTLLGELRIINPKVRVIGLTATPYRLGHGLVAGEGNLFSEIVHDVSVRDLMDAGFLCRVRGKGRSGPDLSGVHHRAGEFVAAEVEAIMEDAERVRLAVAEILRHGADRKAWLVFACSVRHAHLVSDALMAAGITAPVLTGETPAAERDDLIKKYKAGDLRCLVNVNVLTTGFDAPHIDLIALLRPTESPGLYYQMVGRGFRISPGKADCLLLDLAGNIERHGAIETLNQRIVGAAGGAAPQKFCLACEEANPSGAAACQACGAPFFRTCKHCGHDQVPWDAEACPKCNKPMRAQARHATTAAEGDPIVAEEVPPTWHEVVDYDWYPWTKKGAPEGAPRTICVEYLGAFHRPIAREWICVEHAVGSFAHSKAMHWLEDRLLPGWRLEHRDGVPVLTGPTTVRVIDAGIDLGNALRWPTRVATQPDGKWLRVVDYDYTELTDATEPAFAHADSRTYDSNDEPPF